MFADNAKAEQLQQRQRTLERRIRKTKREVMGLKTAVDNATDPAVKSELDREYQRKAALLQKQNKAYNDFCEQNNLKRLQDRLQIAKWDRQQAASARGAAKRYESAKNENSYERIQKKVNTLGTGNANGDNSQPRFIGEINTKKTNEAVEYFGDQIRTSDIEHVYIINDKGQVYYNRGTIDNVSTGDLDLTNCHVLHNHPAENGIMSFGHDDFMMIRDNPIASWHLVNEEYDYSLQVLKPLNDVVYNQIYLKAFEDAGVGEDIQDLAMKVLEKEGYIKYEKRKFIPRRAEKV